MTRLCFPRMRTTAFNKRARTWSSDAMAEADGVKRRSVKQRIRDTKRLLSKDDLPETVRLTKERVLKCLATELQEQQQEARDKKTLKKYRMVKFFDKRKVVRRLKLHLRELRNYVNDAKRCELMSSIEQLRRELNYVVHFPSREKYLALYPSTETTDAQAIARKNQLLEQVNEMINDGELIDAACNLIPSDLLTHFPSSSSSTTSTSDIDMSQRTESTDDDSSVSMRVVHKIEDSRLSRKKRRLYTAPVDEEPTVMKNNRHLATEDDFFILDPHSS